VIERTDIGTSARRGKRITVTPCSEALRGRSACFGTQLFWMIMHAAPTCRVNGGVRASERQVVAEDVTTDPYHVNVLPVRDMGTLRRAVSYVAGLRSKRAGSQIPELVGAGTRSTHID
jgi:hypothetical protein